MITAHHHVLAGVARHNHRAAIEGTFAYPASIRVVPTRLNKTHVNAHAWSMVVAFAILFPAGAPSWVDSQVAWVWLLCLWLVSPVSLLHHHNTCTEAE